MAVNNIIKRIQNIMRSDAGINGDAQRIEQMTWMFFLKVYDTQEETWEYKAYKEKKEFKSIIPEPLRWRNWAIDEKDGEALTGDALLNFINNVLFPVIKGQDVEYKGETVKGIVVNADTPRSKSIVQETFVDLNQYMKDGTLLRQVVNIVNEIEFDDADDRHTFGDIYEGILKDLQSAGNAGEFYTPRALTDFIVKMLNPQLGETFGDFTSGTGGFLTSALNHMAPQVRSAADGELLQRAVVGQEWKPLPYLLSITNLLLHDIEAPNIRHCDSLGTNVSDFKDSDKVDVIGMNPPYGGSTGTSVQSNFPNAYRSSETADLFIALIMYRLKAGGRCGVIIPDGFLFGTDGAKLALKEALLRKFNLHTIIRLPGSIFAPYTSIATNILFFNNEEAEGATEGFRTKDTWFYRLDMPDGYKHFSKTKPMKVEHCQPIIDWWHDRKEIINDDLGEKSKVFTAQQLLDIECNFDQCKFPKDEEEVLPPEELFSDFHARSDKYLKDIFCIIGNLQDILSGKSIGQTQTDFKSFAKYSELIKSIPEALKKSILQEAIQGKLVPQDPNDEPASELLKRIRKEKESLVKEGKVKKKDIVSEPITDEEKLYEIPDSWEWCRLTDICSFLSRGKSPSYSDVPTDYPVFAQKCNLKDGGISLEQSRFLKPETISKWQEDYHLRTGDVLVNSTGTGTVCRTRLFNDSCLGNYQFTVPDSHVSVVRTFDEICSAFIYYLFNSKIYQDYWEDRLAGSTNQKELYIGVLQNTVIPIPSFEEQKRIVAKIEELFKELK